MQSIPALQLQRVMDPPVVNGRDTTDDERPPTQIESVGDIEMPRSDQTCGCAGAKSPWWTVLTVAI